MLVMVGGDWGLGGMRAGLRILLVLFCFISGDERLCKALGSTGVCDFGGEIGAGAGLGRGYCICFVSLYFLLQNGRLRFVLLDFGEFGGDVAARAG